MTGFTKLELSIAYLCLTVYWFATCLPVCNLNWRNNNARTDKNKWNVI